MEKITMFIIFSAGGLGGIYMSMFAPDTLTSVFIFVSSLTFFVGAWYMFSLAKEDKAKRRYSDRPWLVRPDWREGKVRCDSEKQTIRAVGKAIGFGIFFIAPILASPSSGGAKLYALFVVPPGIYLTVMAVREVSRRMRYGDSVFVTACVPVEIGGELSGTVRIRDIVPARRGLRVTLRCVRQIAVESEVKDHTVWEKTLVIEPGYQNSRHPGKTEFSVIIPVPGGLPETDDGGMGDDKILWELKAEAGSGWMKYEANFRLPVFRILEGTAVSTENT